MNEPWTMVGLGLMGTALVERWREAGRSVRVWNRTADKAAPLAALGARWTDRPFAHGGTVVISLYSSAVVDEVLRRFESDLVPGTIIVDTTTGDPDDAVRFATRLAANGIAYLDAPISGSSEQTRRGEATVMVGGDPAAFEHCRELWPLVGRHVFHCGPSGSAARMKLVTNLVLGLNRAALAEGLAFAEATGVDPRAALKVLRNSAAYSRQMDAKGEKMLTGDYTPVARLSQHLKDVRLMLGAAESSGIELPLSRTHRELLERAEAAGWGELDNSVIRRVWEGEAR